MKRRTISRFEPGSYGEQCAKFFDDTHEWKLSRWKNLASRAIAWSHSPYRYILTQYGRETTQEIRPKIIHTMFQVAAVSIEQTVEDLHSLERWDVQQPYLHRPETVMYFNHSVGMPVQEHVSGEILKSAEFVMDHGLYVPNTHDLDTLDAILEHGRLDDYEPLSFRHE